MTDERIMELWAKLEEESERPDQLALDFARAIEREVREECAKVCEGHLVTGATDRWDSASNFAARSCADAIRKGNG